MIKIAQKHIKIKATSLKYLYEVAAIPIETREQFLKKLLKRKNASQQKNVKLLLIIYQCTNDGEMLSWDEEEICNKLDISKGMLYCHKHYILKELRLLYFNWKDIEEKEFKNETKYQDEISLKYAKAKKMETIGMEKEARSLFKKIMKELTSPQRKVKYHKLILFHSYRFLCKYHLHKNDLKNFNYCFRKLEKLGKSLIKKHKELHSLIMSYLYLNTAYKYNFKGNITESNKFLKQAFEIVKKTSDDELKVFTLCNLCQIETYQNNKVLHKKYIDTALKLSKKLNLSTIINTFRIMNLKIKYIEGKIDPQKVISEVKNIFQTVNNRESAWTNLLLFNIISILSHLNEDWKDSKNLFYKALYKYNSGKIIYNGLNSALRLLFFMKFSFYLVELKKLTIQTHTKSQKEYITLAEVNSLFLRKLDNAILELTISTNNKNMDIYFRKDFFTVMLFTDFWKGKNCSLEYANHILKQIKWIEKTRKLGRDNEDNIDIAYFGINVMTDFKNLTKNEFLIKFESKFKYYIDAILESKTLKLSIYYLLSFIAEQCEYEELKDMCRKAFWKLEEKYPEMIKDTINQIKEKENLESRLNYLNPLSVQAA